MKKTYMTPAMLAVMLLHQDNVLDLKTSFPVVGPGSGESDVKAFDFVDDEDAGTTTASPRNIWDEEW